MIKILFYIDDLRAGGAEMVLCNLVNNMDQSIFDITVHTTYKGNQDLLAPGIHYKYVYEQRTKVNHIAYRIEAQLGIFYQMHLKGDYDIEVAYLECGPTKIMASSTNKKSVKFAWVHCDLAKKMPDIDSFVKKTKRYYGSYDKVICVSDDCKKTFMHLFPDISSVEVLHNTVDSEQILSKVANDKGLPEKNGFTFVTMGRLMDQKNYRLLLKCHKQLIDDGLISYIWILGEGEDRKDLEKYVTDNHLGEYIKFMGFQSNPYCYVNAADAYICSSKYEGYSTAVVEALILEKTVITTDCTGMREILGDSEYGYIVPNDEVGLLEGMKTFLTNPSLVRQYQLLSKNRGAQLSGKEITRVTEECFLNMMETINR